MSNEKNFEKVSTTTDKIEQVLESFQDPQTSKYGFRNKETGKIVVVPVYPYVLDFQYFYGNQYIAVLGEHEYLTPDGKIHAFPCDEI